MNRNPSDPSGPNQWLIDEMYRRYVENPSSVAEAWQEFFEDYTPQTDGRNVAPPLREAPAKEAPAPEAPPPTAEPPAVASGQSTLLRGADAALARHMEKSLEVPTATSVRTIPAKLLEVNRNIINRYLQRTRGGKVSFTHLIGWAVVRALEKVPGMRNGYALADGKPARVFHEHVNLGLAVDIRREDGTRTLMVPNISSVDSLDFSAYLSAYEDLIRKVHGSGAAGIRPDDLSGTTHTITNPGMIGTVQSVPRLMSGQSVIVGVGTIAFPAEFQAADPEVMAQLGVSKVITITSTYDHRVIQGAESGEFLGWVHRLLLGEERFYEEIFESLRVPYVPARWIPDYNPSDESSIEVHSKHGRVLQLINMYRVRGHLIAHLDPLETKPPELHSELDPTTFGLSIWDLDRTFITGGLAGSKEMTLGEILGVLRDAYCRTASVEYMHISAPDQKTWIQQRVEGVGTVISPEDQRHVLHKLNEAESFETFMHQKYVGHKRFSLEGAESMIVMLDAILDGAADRGLDEVVIGMAHRGRLNVLANIIGKSYTQIFREFEGDIDPTTAQGSGDVKYHLGASGKHKSRAGNDTKVSVASNPSHLESVDPVVEGMVRAKQDILDRPLEFPVLPILIHGDAAFAGQGVVAETLNLSQLSGYRVGGTIHVVVNNQLGFTTGSDYGRSSRYATDVAKMVEAPIFHVNGDDPEACLRVSQLAFDFCQTFRKDVVIDMWCYRRWGHNEADEPSFTQPLMYESIKNRRSVRKLYTERLVNRGDLALEEAEGLLEEFRSKLQKAFDETRQGSVPPVNLKRSTPIPARRPIETGVGRDVLERVLDALTTVPVEFDVHAKLAKWLQERKTALSRDQIEWALAEALAFGSLLVEGTTIRLAGQDTRRGTFSQRHSTLVDQSNGREFSLLSHLSGEGAKYFVYDSLLSEVAALGFEYGYSVAHNKALVLWEAQFGDFTNGAQVVIDEFITTAEDKWGQKSGLVLLLPHGFEGQGPDHSSSRLERFLEQAAEDNLQVAVPSTPAQYFHLLRRQVHADVRKPLVVMTPKSLLRLPTARSATRELETGHFENLLHDDQKPDEVKTLMICQGKIFYELAEKRSELEAPVSIVRLEQLYPFPEQDLREVIESNADAEVVWVQEEPINLGAAPYVQLKFPTKLGVTPKLIARDESASPASGSFRIHQAEQTDLLERAFGLSGSS